MQRHFLVEVKFISPNHIVYHPTTKFQAEFSKACRRKNGDGALGRAWLNPASTALTESLAVELAKLSLWLTTISSDQP